MAKEKSEYNQRVERDLKRLKTLKSRRDLKKFETRFVQLMAIEEVEKMERKKK